MLAIPPEVSASPAAVPLYELLLRVEQTVRDSVATLEDERSQLYGQSWPDDEKAEQIGAHALAGLLLGKLGQAKKMLHADCASRNGAARVRRPDVTPVVECTKCGGEVEMPEHALRVPTIVRCKCGTVHATVPPPPAPDNDAAPTA